MPSRSLACLVGAGAFAFLGLVPCLVGPGSVAFADDQTVAPAAPNLPSPAPKPADQKAAEPKPAEPKPAEPKPVEAKSAEPPAGTSAVVLDLNAVRGLMGHAVRTSAGEEMGHVVDILVAPDGQIRAVVLDFGGVLGVGSRKVAVDWKLLSFGDFSKDGPVQVLLTRNQIRVAPEFKPNEPIVVLEATLPAGAPTVGQAKTEAARPGPPQAVAPAGTPSSAPSTGSAATPKTAAPGQAK